MAPWWSLWVALAGLVSIPSAAYPTSSSTSEESTSLTLQAIHIRDFEAVHGLHRRSMQSLSNLNLQDQSQLVYGSQTGGGDALFANMTLFAPDGLQIISMESFDGLTKYITCDNATGTISLAFNSQKAFIYAVATWSHVNQNETARFLLIASQQGCAPAGQRQPYYINNVTEIAQDLTTRLVAQPANWSDVASKYDLDFGHAALSQPQHPSRLSKRGFWDNIGNAFKNLGNTILNGLKQVGNDILGGLEEAGHAIVDGVEDAGNAIVDGAEQAGQAIEKGADEVGNAIGGLLTGTTGVSASLNFPMNMGTPGERFNLYNDTRKTTSIDCLNCFVNGSWQVSGRLSVHWWQIQQFEIDAEPHGFNAALILGANISEVLKPSSTSFTKELFSAAIPNAGFEIPAIFKIGATVSWDVGVGAAFVGAASVDFGLQSSMPDSAKAVLDLKNLDQSSAVGFNGAVQPVFNVKALSASLSLFAFSQPKLAFGIEISKIGKADIALPVKLPQVNVDFTPGYNKDGFCGGGPTTGVKVNSNVTIEIDAIADLAFGASEFSARPAWSRKLFGWGWPIFSKCFPISIPGLDSDVVAGPSLTLPVSLPLSLTTQGATEITTAPSPSVPSAVPVLSRNGSYHLTPGVSRSMNNTPRNGSNTSRFSRFVPSGPAASGVFTVKSSSTIATVKNRPSGSSKRLRPTAGVPGMPGATAVRSGASDLTSTNSSSPLSKILPSLESTTRSGVSMSTATNSSVLQTTIKSFATSTRSRPSHTKTNTSSLLSPQAPPSTSSLRLLNGTANAEAEPESAAASPQSTHSTAESLPSEALSGNANDRDRVDGVQHTIAPSQPPTLGGNRKVLLAPYQNRTLATSARYTQSDTGVVRPSANVRH